MIKKAVTKRAGVEFKNLKKRGPLRELPAINPVYQQMQNKDHREGDRENDEAFHLMEDSLRKRGIVLTQNSSDGNAAGVGENGNRHHGDEQGPPHPHLAIE